mmetsp:Transcript_3958/g.10180  ORF Transcript_3958/g.10180 Transcript_3958/m.10180 type:complete len:90 (+) Transcript_3958:592-861(+)
MGKRIAHPLMNFFENHELNTFKSASHAVGVRLAWVSSFAEVPILPSSPDKSCAESARSVKAAPRACCATDETARCSGMSCCAVLLGVRY